MNIFVKVLQKLKSRGAVESAARERIESVLALPLDRVKQHALELLSDRQRFKCVRGRPGDNWVDDRLGPILREFFSQFESVEEVNGDFSVNRSGIGGSSLRPGLLRIGSDFADSEIVVRPGEDRVFIVTDAEHALEGLPTIYHSIYLLE